MHMELTQIVVAKCKGRWSLSDPVISPEMTIIKLIYFYKDILFINTYTHCTYYTYMYIHT